MSLKTSAFLLLSFCLAFAGCDKDDPNDTTPNCFLEAAFKAGDLAICASGSSNQTIQSLSISLRGEEGETLSIVVLGTNASRYAIPAGNATYTDLSGKSFASTSGGTIEFTSIDGEFDGSFSFDATSSTGETISITEGVFENL